MDIKQQLGEILSVGKNTLHLNVGIISHIVGETYTIKVIDSDYTDLQAGGEYTLSDTYCKDVAANRKTMFYKNVAEITELLKHPIYLSLQLRAYIGTPIMVNGELWGTLNYSSKTPRKTPFADSDIQLLESQAETITKLIGQ